MNCPTCTETMNMLGFGFCHCPRCGTLRREDAIYVPALVTRCRAFPVMSGLTGSGDHEWSRLGIPDALGKKS